MTIRSNSRHQFSVTLSATPEDSKIRRPEDACACEDECMNFPDKCKKIIDDHGKEHGVENCWTKTMCYDGCMKAMAGYWRIILYSLKLCTMSMFYIDYLRVFLWNYPDCLVAGEFGDGTEQGTCNEGEFCFADGSCRGL